MICISRTRAGSWVAAALLALAGCGGGGDDSTGANRALAQTPAQTPAQEPCLPPVTADCVIEAASRTYTLHMVGGRQSDYALRVREGTLELVPPNSSAGAVDFRFSGGTTIEGDTMLKVDYRSNLHSDVVVQPAGRLELGGALVGNVVNDGVLTPRSSIYQEDAQTTLAHIDGALSQSPASTLDAVIGATSGGFVSIAGHADIDGTLRLTQYTDDWGPYPLPTAPVSIHVLHADGGVFGRFATWTSPGLLITGNLRYLDSDIFLDVTSISAAK